MTTGLPLLLAQAVEPLRSPPLFEHLLLENPWAVSLTLALLGLFFFWFGRQRRKRWMPALLPVCWLLAGGVWLLASAVETDREKILRHTEELVQATTPLDLNRIDALLLPETQLLGPNGDLWLRYGEIRQELEHHLHRHQVATQTFRALGAEVIRRREGLPPQGRSLFDLRTDLAGVSNTMPIRSKWTALWEKQPDGSWRVTEIHWREFMHSPPRRGYLR